MDVTASGLVLSLAVVVVVPIIVLFAIISYDRWTHRRKWDAHADEAVAAGNDGRCPRCLIEVEDMAQHYRLRHNSAREQPDHEKL